MCVKACQEYSIKLHEPLSKQKNLVISNVKLKSKSDSATEKNDLTSEVVERLDKVFRNCHALVIKNRVMPGLKETVGKNLIIDWEDISKKMTALSSD